MGFTSHQQMHGGPPGVLLGAPTSLASTVVIGPHHAAVTHAGDSSEVGQREHVVRLGIHRKCWSEFLCLGGYLTPPQDALGRHPPSADPCRAAAPPAGPWQEPNLPKPCIANQV
jgi:hypothetical protein